MNKAESKSHACVVCLQLGGVGGGGGGGVGARGGCLGGRGLWWVGGV